MTSPQPSPLTSPAEAAEKPYQSSMSPCVSLQFAVGAVGFAFRDQRRLLVRPVSLSALR